MACNRVATRDNAPLPRGTAPRFFQTRTRTGTRDALPIVGHLDRKEKKKKKKKNTKKDSFSENRPLRETYFTLEPITINLICMATVVVRGTRRNRPPIIVYFAFPEAIDIRLLANARDSTDLKRISLGPFRWRQLFYRFRRENGLGLLARECLGRVQLFLLRKYFRSLYGLYFLRGCSNATTSSHGRGRVKSWIRTI